MLFDFLVNLRFFMHIHPLLFSLEERLEVVFCQHWHTFSKILLWGIKRRTILKLLSFLGFAALILFLWIFIFGHIAITEINYSAMRCMILILIRFLVILILAKILIRMFHYKLKFRLVIIFFFFIVIFWGCVFLSIKNTLFWLMDYSLKLMVFSYLIPSFLARCWLRLIYLLVVLFAFRILIWRWSWEVFFPVVFFLHVMYLRLIIFHTLSF